MQRINVRVDERLKQEVEAEAREKGVRPSDIVRQALEEHLKRRTPPLNCLELAERLVLAVRGVRLQAPYEDERISVSAGATIADPANLPVERLTDGVHLAKLLGKNLARFVD